MDNETLASELLHEVKSSARRWFIIAMVELAVIAILIVVYFVIPVEEYSVQQEAHDTESTRLVGGDYYGQTEDNIQEETGSR